MLRPFPKDSLHKTYNPEHAHTWWQVLVPINNVFKTFRSRFIGKCSPVHFFWGSFDLAVTRFSGRPAPEHPGNVPHLPDSVAKEAYSHEVSSCGFWPGNEMFPEAAFYSYAYPEPKGFSKGEVQPTGAYYHEAMREFILPYKVVKNSKDPNRALLDFLQTTYEAAAIAGDWNRELLESSPFKDICEKSHKS